METEWISTEQAMEILGMGRMPVNRLAREGKLHARVAESRIGRGQRPWEFNRQSVEERAQRMKNAPPGDAVDTAWMPIAEAQKALNMTRHGIKRRIKMGFLESAHFGPPEKLALYVSREQVQEQMLNPPASTRRTAAADIPAEELDLAWFAGFFDGEGCIYVYSRLRDGYTAWNLKLSMPNSGVDALLWIEQTIGGHTYARPRQKAHYRDQRVWQASADEAMAILQLIRPYLKVKHLQADLAIEFQEHIRSKQGSRWAPVTIEEQDWRKAQKEKIHRLNKPNGE